jgi:hypothetical protein
MRTTVELPPGALRRAREIAEQRGQSLSSVVADLTIRGLAQFDEPVQVTTDPLSGFPMISLGRRISSDDVAIALDEE